MAQYLTGEVWNEDQLEETLPTGRKVTINKVITLDLVINNVIFTQEYFVLPITNPIILGSDFLNTHFTVLDIGDHTITLHCDDNMLTTSLTHDLLLDWCLAKIVALVATGVLYKKIWKEMEKNTPTYITLVQYQSKFLLPQSMLTMLPALLHLLAVQYNAYFSG